MKYLRGRLHSPGASRCKALQGGVLASLNKSFQTRLYRLDEHAGRIDDVKELQPNAASTRIGESLKGLSEETSDLPIGAVVLLSDGDDNTGGIGADAISALRARHIPVHTVGFGHEHASHDVELDDVVLAPEPWRNPASPPRSLCTSAAYRTPGRRSTLTVKDASTAAARQASCLRLAQ